MHATRLEVALHLWLKSALHVLVVVHVVSLLHLWVVVILPTLVVLVVVPERLTSHIVAHVACIVVRSLLLVLHATTTTHVLILAHILLLVVVVIVVVGSILSHVGLVGHALVWHGIVSLTLVIPLVASLLLTLVVLIVRLLLLRWRRHLVAWVELLRGWALVLILVWHWHIRDWLLHLISHHWHILSWRHLHLLCGRHTHLLRHRGHIVRWSERAATKLELRDLCSLKGCKWIVCIALRSTHFVIVGWGHRHRTLCSVLSLIHYWHWHRALV